MKYLEIRAIDAHAYLDESRVSASDLVGMASSNNLSKIIISPACTKSHEPDKHPAMYWFQRQILKTGVLTSVARLVSASFYDKKGELKTASGFHLRLGIAYRNDEGRYVSSDLYSINVISLVLGIGFDINETLTIVADYSQQLSNSQSNSQTFIDDSIKTNRLGVSIQFFF